MSLSKPFEKQVGMNILKAAEKEFTDTVDYLRMFQNVLASSIGSINYIFATSDIPEGNGQIRKKTYPLQHYNRVFIMKDGTPGCVHLRAANARQIPPATIAKRAKNNEKPQQHDPLAWDILQANGVDTNDLGTDKECIIKKVTNIDPEWDMYVCNKDLHYLSDEELAFIKDNLDYEKYNGLLADGFKKNWQNDVPKIVTITDAIIYEAQIKQAEEYLVKQETNDPAQAVLQDLGQILLHRDLYAE